VVLVADHGYPYPRTLTYNEPLRHRIPMIWTGGAVAGPRVVEGYAAQIGIAATLLAERGVAHGEVAASAPPTPLPTVSAWSTPRARRCGTQRATGW